MLSTESIQKIYTRNYNTIKAYVKDISNEESRINPQLAGNNINWTLGHMVRYRSDILSILEQEAFWDKETFAPYDFGSSLLPEDKGLPFNKLVEQLDKSQETLVTTLENLDEAFLETELNEGKTTVGARLEFYAWHEGYHTGQLALLRRIIGKDISF